MKGTVLCIAPSRLIGRCQKKAWFPMTIDEATVWLKRHADNTPMPGAMEAYKTILEELDGVRRGWWLDGVDGSMLRICSLCGFRAGAPSHRFCPAYGAKMENEKVGNGV